jgi:hypothetical protein
MNLPEETVADIFHGAALEWLDMKREDFLP